MSILYNQPGVLYNSLQYFYNGYLNGISVIISNRRVELRDIVSNRVVEVEGV